MDIDLLPLRPEDVPQFKRDMQEAFQQGAAEIGESGDADEEVLPEADIDRSLSAKGAVAYKAVPDGQMAGGAIIVIDAATRRGELHFLYVRHGIQSRGIGQAIWRAIEQRHPEVAVWETVTPAFEKRNIHFYVKCCGFTIAGSFNPPRHGPHATEGGGDEEGMLRFQKVMRAMAST